ncbi:long-chain fatty acid--CoA ligase [Nocardioides sp. AN3]
MSWPGNVSGVADLLGLAALESPAKLALVEAGGRSLTWGGLDEEVSRVATGLGEAGIVAGHRVVIAMSNRLEFVVAYLATLRAQAVAVPVNPRATGTEIARMVGHAGARLVLADSDAIGAVREAMRQIDRAMAGELDLGAPDAELLRRTVRPRIYVLGAPARSPERDYAALRADVIRPSAELTDPERLAVLLYTSGASGRPRAAMLTHRALLANLDQIAAVDPPMIHEDDVVLGVLPLFHVYGLNAVLGSVLRRRAKLLLVDQFEPQGTLDLIEDEACSVVPVAPPVIASWVQDHVVDDRLGPVRLLLSGSAPLDPGLADAFTERTGIGVHQGYGLTEAAPVVTSTLCSTSLERGSVGAALPGVELRLVDEDGAAPELGDPGEIHVRGDNLFSGYWPDGAEGPDADGWWATGDVGFLSPSGDLTLVDRIKDLVIVSGFNVYPIEVEETIGEVEGVAAVAVIGVPDPATGEAVVAYVVPAGAAPPDLVERILARCAERLAGFKRPTRVELVDALPHTPTGKVQKGRLRTIERRRVQEQPR